eukprot:2903713-Amphidinium_carterae.1
MAELAVDPSRLLQIHRGMYHIEADSCGLAAAAAGAVENGSFDTSGKPIPISPSMITTSNLAMNLPLSWLLTPDKSRLAGPEGHPGP